MDKLSNLELIELIKAYISKEEEEKNKQEKKKDILIKDKLKYYDINDFTFTDFVDYNKIKFNLKMD